MSVTLHACSVIFSYIVRVGITRFTQSTHIDNQSGSIDLRVLEELSRALSNHVPFCSVHLNINACSEHIPYWQI